MSRILDLPNAKLIESAIANAEGTLTDTGAFLALTGNRTGRSPKDRFIVKESSTADKIDWGEVNRPFDSDHFDASTHADTCCLDTFWRSLENCSITGV